MARSNYKHFLCQHGGGTGWRTKVEMPPKKKLKEKIKRKKVK
jgi:hypothetical protein